MNIYCVDDNLIHRRKAVELVEEACKKKGVKSVNIVECENGEDLLAKASRVKPNLILLDIHMPVLDGLSTLVRYRVMDKSTKVVMVSSESKSAVSRFKKGGREAVMDDAQKRELLERVVQRVSTGNNVEGKINSVLEACGNLEMDPVAVAKICGANDYINKPYSVSDASETLSRMISMSDVIAH